MNQDDIFKLKVYPQHEAFGSNLNDDDDDSDMPFRNYQKPIGFFYDGLLLVLYSKTIAIF
jgi:hypothetical protein